MYMEHWLLAIANQQTTNQWLHIIQCYIQIILMFSILTQSFWVLAQLGKEILVLIQPSTCNRHLSPNPIIWTHRLILDGSSKSINRVEATIITQGVGMGLTILILLLIIMGLLMLVQTWSHLMEIAIIWMFNVITATTWRTLNKFSSGAIPIQLFSIPIIIKTEVIKHKRTIRVFAVLVAPVPSTLLLLAWLWEWDK